ncbi:MAG: protein tyrosine phosphatase [Legionella sp.]|uniref:protein tyrosine phosphatase n=1 Tax=Legionella sp. TaxID=459 RepID=UPI0039E4CCB8
MKYYFVISLFFCHVTYALNHIIMVGDEKVEIKHYIGKGKTFIHVHHNEQTALKAAQEVIKKTGGSLITLEHSGGRNIVFHLHNKCYEFDPNRIFTDVGIKKTLTSLSQYSSEAHREVKKLADKIKQILPKGKVVAVHNNSSYSLKDYLPGNVLEGDAQAVHILLRNYYRNFYLVTKISDFLRLKSKGYNGVLQRNSATDDGSLSVYLAKRDYINVEAGYDQLMEQIKMLQHA